MAQVNMAQVRRLVKNRFGHNDLRQTYCEGSRSLGDMLETIIRADLEGDEREAEFWRCELATMFPNFNETV